MGPSTFVDTFNPAFQTPVFLFHCSLIESLGLAAKGSRPDKRGKRWAFKKRISRENERARTRNREHSSAPCQPAQRTLFFMSFITFKVVLGVCGHLSSRPGGPFPQAGIKPEQTLRSRRSSFAFLRLLSFSRFFSFLSSLKRQRGRGCELFVLEEPLGHYTCAAPSEWTGLDSKFERCTSSSSALTMRPKCSFDDTRLIVIYLSRPTTSE